ncbi:MAG: synthetase [Phycisphaerales bacterium]|nr:synthetase [Phycisphaerales bacterium]
MRIALCQINPTVGDLAGNAAKHVDFIARAKAAGAELAVFPELSLLGYPPKDLLLKRSFVDENLRAVERLAAGVTGIDVIVGYAERNPNPVGRPLHNAVALLRDGRVASRHLKTLLPTYDVFDESRYFEPGAKDEHENLVPVTAAGGRRHVVGMSVCEDLWNDEQLIARRLYHENPIGDLMSAGAELLVNASASPFVVGKHAFRLELIAAQARRFGKPIVYVNQVGGNDELVFDGNSVVIDGSGRVVGHAKGFVEDLLVVDVEVPALAGQGTAGATGTSAAAASAGAGGSPLSPRERAGVRVSVEVDGVSSTGRPAGAASTGSIDIQPHPNPLPGGEGTGGAAALRASHAYAGERVGLKAAPAPGEPDAGSPDGGYADADLADVFNALVLGLRDYVYKTGFKSVVLGLSGGIDSALVAALAVEAFGPDKVVGVGMPSRYSSGHSVDDARQLAANLGMTFHVVPIQGPHLTFEAALSEVFAGTTADVTEENLQARSRGVVLMAMSNKFNHLLLTTGNKSELAVGYCTLYGDMCGGLAVISDVPKTLVWALSRYYNKLKGTDAIPRNSIEKPPSAELRPGQVDQDSLPPYEILDGILFRYVEEEKGPRQIAVEGFDPAVVDKMLRLIDRSEYKRRQAAPGIKVTSRAFGSGRRMPIAQRYVPAVVDADGTLLNAAR